MFWKRKAKTESKVAVSKSPHAALMEKFKFCKKPTAFSERKY